jgi:hypothetical protein
MNCKAIFVFLVAGLLCFGSFTQLMAQFSPPPPPQSGPSGAPIDGGAIGLLVACAAYGSREKRKRKARKNDADCKKEAFFSFDLFFWT